jgi:hypothetical protein
MFCNCVINILQHGEVINSIDSVLGKERLGSVKLHSKRLLLAGPFDAPSSRNFRYPTHADYGGSVVVKTLCYKPEDRRFDNVEVIF